MLNYSTHNSTDLKLNLLYNRALEFSASQTESTIYIIYVVFRWENVKILWQEYNLPSMHTQIS